MRKPVSRLHPQSSAHTGGAVRRGSARARVRRATAAAWDTLTMNRAPLQVRARTAGADRRRARRTCAAGPVHASREGAALREQRSTGQGYAHAGVTRVPRAAGSKGPAEAQAGQWSKPRTAREGEKLCVRTTRPVGPALNCAVGGSE